MAPVYLKCWADSAGLPAGPSVLATGEHTGPEYGIYKLSGHSSDDAAQCLSSKGNYICSTCITHYEDHYIHLAC